MPTYEYECPECLSRFELRRSFNDDTPVSCPRCHCPAQRLFVPVPVIFKGSGFYVTDNRKDNHLHNESSDSGSDTPRPASSGTEDNTPE